MRRVRIYAHPMPRRPTLVAAGRAQLPARARRARAGQHREAGAALPGLPARQPLEPARRRAAGRGRLGGARAQHRPRPAGAPRLRRRPVRGAADRHPVHDRVAPPAARARVLRLRRRVRPRPLPDPAARADRGRAQRRRRPPRDRRGPRPLPAVRAVRRLSAGGRQALARRLGRGLEPALEPPPPARLDLGRRRRPADPARPGPLRGGAPRRDRPRAALHRASARGARTCIPARHFASSSDDPDLPPMGLRVRLRAGFDTSGFPRQARIVLDGAEALRDDPGRQRLALVHQRRAVERLEQRATCTSCGRVQGADFEVVDTSSLPRPGE